MEIEKWFHTPIWVDNLNFDTEKVAKKCLQLRESGYPSRKFSNIGGYQSCNINLTEHYEFLDIANLLDLKINELKDSINPNLIFRLSNAWININEKGCGNGKHVHPSSVFSGTIYVQTDDDTGDIVFFNDHSPIKHYPFQHWGSDMFHDTVSYKPKNGMIILFPSWIPHSVQNSKSDIPRISISFNLLQYYYGL